MRRIERKRKEIIPGRCESFDKSELQQRKKRIEGIKGGENRMEYWQNKVINETHTKQSPKNSSSGIQS